MIKYTSKKGISIAEMTIVCLITALITLGTVQMTNNAFIAQANYNEYIRAKQEKNAISERISSKVKEASKAYYTSLALSIPIGDSLYSVVPEYETLAVIIPKFDSTGTLVQPEPGITTFTGVAFSIIPKSDIESDTKDTSAYVLIETNAEFNLTTSLSDPVTVTESLPESWDSGQSYVIADNLKPAIFSTLGTDAFDVEGDMVNYAFVPKGDDVYFPSEDSVEKIADDEYLTRCKFRNFRI